MSAILNVRDAIRDFLRKYDEIVTPLFRFIVCFIMFNYVNSMYGYSELFERGTVIFLLSVICALVSDKVAVIVAFLVIGVNTFAVSLEVGITFVILAIIIYFTYMRMFVDSCWVLVLVPILFKLGFECAVPMIVMIFIGLTGIVPTAFGAVLYYFSVYTAEVKSILDAKTADSDFQAYAHILEGLMKNKDMLAEIIVFAVAIAVGYVVYRLKINYAWYIGIGVCALVNVIAFAVVAPMVGSELSVGSAFVSTLLGAVIALLLQLAKSVVDYSRKEVVQFEDDEYYYYVTAIPKYNVKTDKKKSEATAKSAEKKEKQTAVQKANSQKTVQKANAQSAGQRANAGAEATLKVNVNNMSQRQNR